MTPVLHQSKEFGRAAPVTRSRLIARISIHVVLSVSHISEVICQRRVRVLARPFQAGIDRRRVFFVERENSINAFALSCLWLEKGDFAFGDGKAARAGSARAFPVPNGSTLASPEDARHVLGALHLSAHPRPVGDSREHGLISRPPRYPWCRRPAVDDQRTLRERDPRQPPGPV